MNANRDWRSPVWVPHAGIFREGSLDYQRIPSRVGAALVPYSPPIGALGRAGPPPPLELLSKRPKGAE